MPVLTPQNSTIVMIDHAVGFGNLFRSHDLAQHVNNTVALAKVAKTFNIPLVLTNGDQRNPAGPLFRQLQSVIADTPVIVRGGNFDAFGTPEFAQAVAAAGRQKLVISGLMSEGCVLQTALSGLERGYEVFVVVDVIAGETLEAHQVAVQRMVQAGVVPVTWMSIASEYQVTYENQETLQQFMGLMVDHSATLGMFLDVNAAQQNRLAAV